MKNLFTILIILLSSILVVAQTPSNMINENYHITKVDLKRKLPTSNEEWSNIIQFDQCSITAQYHYDNDELIFILLNGTQNETAESIEIDAQFSIIEKINNIKYICTDYEYTTTLFKYTNSLVWVHGHDDGFIYHQTFWYD